MLKSIEIFLKNILLKILLNLNLSDYKTESTRFNANSRLMFIRLNRIGDALVTTPLLFYLKEKLKCRIDILADRKNYFVFEKAEFIDNVYIFPKGIKGFRYFRKLSKQNSYDAVIDLHDDISTTVSFLIASYPTRNKFGFAKGNENVYNKTVIKPDSKTVHIVDRILTLTKLFDLEFPKEKLNINYKLLPESLEYIDNFLANNFQTSKFLLGINISAGSDARFWGVERYKNLIHELKKYDINLFIITAEKDLKYAEEISQNTIPLFCEKDFNKFAAIVSKLNFLITPDTAIVHLASAYDIPVFGIYVKYKTTDMIWSPYNSPFEYFETIEPNLQNVSFESVKEKLIPFLLRYLD